MAKKKDSYESLMAKLQEIVENMEKGELSLEDSIRFYEEGIKTSNSLYKMLKEAEGKITILNEEKETSFEDDDLK
ncbi:exodeoxyribonuclease VII small subunit [Clostridium sp. 19966]|uniref:exodeoxyribonuclease VII small subunit n=1 Tax=Clostridium sp. 19966 TaxID=2768166 RepID=UPI0028DE76DE|nr:exodeoxyribonuclease VII small subunit [Clostridium sp. 19966]MDT8716577.1 exodeoxyribonuclease VII small subunit [Clostridium sp. 19966]